MSRSDSEDGKTPTAFAYSSSCLLGVDTPVNAIPAFPLEHEEDGSVIRRRCPTAVIDWGGRPLTIRERAMMSMISEVMEKAHWEQKVFDEGIVAKWHSEAVSEERNFSDAMFKFVSCVTLAPGSLHTDSQ